ncbi:Trm112 family protein [Allobaculum sp. Allo2]|uniref:Trm112 family protein n=1 Tax=Allobaculum sp. Allo2 TaxID=2853432 RepID=UPI001F620625|nr:Trm112 family protein [Allobaculum sp. Allo2]UNT93472.1 hypothetical protein KWG61_01240 [Allobaculum sp. Allo2]
MEYKCSNCGGELQFDPESGKLKCPFCGRVQELNEQENAGQSQKDWSIMKSMKIQALASPV